MSEIPEDIMKSASDAAHSCFSGTSIRSNQGKLTIARAILAERKRCADVARRLNGWGSDCGRGGHAEHIAAAIMRGSNT